MRRHLRKFVELLRNPSKIQYLEGYLRRELSVFRGKKVSRSISSVEVVFDPRSVSEYERVINVLEEDIIADILSETTEDDVFYDIGANIGTYSCFIGNYTGSKVVAFEPFPKNAESLRRNLKLNSIDGEVFELALMNEDGSKSIESMSDDPGEGQVLVTGEGDMEVHISKGDSLITEKGLASPSIIKIDVEGAELEVLRGLEECVSGDLPRLIYLEVHRKKIKRFGGSVKELEEFLENRGFELNVLDDRGNDYHLKASRRSN